MLLRSRRPTLACSMPSACTLILSGAEGHLCPPGNLCQLGSGPSSQCKNTPAAQLFFWVICLWARPMNMNFEFVQHVCYDSENALLEYGHNPRPRILNAKKKDGRKPRSNCDVSESVQQVCLDTQHAILESCGVLPKSMATACE